MGINLWKKAVCLLVAVSLMLAVTACQKGNASTQADATMQKLAEEFADDLSTEIIQYRENPEWLADLDLVVGTPDASYNTSYLDDFASKADSGQNCYVTMAFKSTSLVFCRVVFQGGQGYYLRYAYDSKNTDKVSITSQLVDTVEVIKKPDLDKVEFELREKKSQTVTFSFQNVSAGQH